MFAQAVYLMFASVYVCKETIEHLLLSSGGSGGEAGHHHHHHLGIDFPRTLTLLSFLSTLGTALTFHNHSKLVNIAGNRIPSLRALIRTISTSRGASIAHSPSHLGSHFYDPPPTTPIGIALSNPYVASPLLFSIGILSVALFADAEQHQLCDLGLASLIAVVTGKVSYQACVVLGTVLLQTAPSRGLSGGKMENFLRAMREIERHPLVLHLPAPHIWQLTPAHLGLGRMDAGAGTAKGRQDEHLVVSLELHVREDLADDDALSLTKWAWERCANAGGKGTGVEVTVGVVKG